MTARSCLAIVLAAGEGTRMRSSKAKVLHEVAGQSLLAHVLAAIAEAGVTSAAVVIGPGQDEVAAEAKRVLPDAVIFTQHERRGTAHAVLAAKSGDRKTVRRHSHRLRRHAADPAGDAVASARAARRRRGHCGARLSARRSAGYGRLIMAGDELIAIREEADASAERTQDRSLQRRHHGVCRRTARLPSWNGSATTTANMNSI